jgi:hypothetical protein
MPAVNKRWIFAAFVALAFYASAAHADLSGDANKALDKTGEGVKKAAKGVQKGLNKAGDELEDAAKGAKKGLNKAGDNVEKAVKGKSKGKAKDKDKSE